MPKLFGKSISLPKMFRRGRGNNANTGATGLGGFSDPMLDINWIMTRFNPGSVEVAARYQGCYFAAWMHVDTPEYLSSTDLENFRSASDQLNPSSPQADSVMQLADMSMSASITAEAAEQLRKYYHLLSVVRSAQHEATRYKVSSVWGSMVAACGGDGTMAGQVAQQLNDNIVPVVMEEYLRYLQGFGPNSQPAGSILIPTGDGYQLRTVVM
ncbi:hypothetical protein [Fodinicurvata sp. EGI_FJ10296]|uniref:hypothetical protein n=1 Tax=Fodinicurvata sp. EGI_FJ10296 TaxID=3231908 RepID=UPI003453749C